MKPFVFCVLVLMNIVNSDLVVTASDSQIAFLDDEAILAGWESTYAGIRTMSFSYVNRLIDFQPPQIPNENTVEPISPVKYDHVERIEAGRRYHLRYSLAEDGFDDPEWLVEYAFNGRNTQSYLGNTKSGQIFPGLRGGSEETDNVLKRAMFITNHNTPEILKDKYPNGIPELALWFRLGKLRGKVIVRPYLEYVAGELCHVVEIIDDSKIGGTPREIKQVYWMAHDKGMCPMKFQSLLNSKLESEIAVEKIAVTDMDGNDIWYPAKAYRVESSEKTGMIKTELTVTDFIPNVEVDENTFRFDFPPGTRVSDRIAGLSYIVGGTGLDGEVLPVSDISSTEKKQTPNGAKQQTTDIRKSPSEEHIDGLEQPIDKEQKEVSIPEESAPYKDKIVGVQTISILGVTILAGLGLLLWYKRSART